LVVRSCQAQALMPMMQFSVAPWRVLSEEECNICRDFANLHVRFAPYIMELVRHAAESGEPVVRMMEYEFPGQGFDRRMTQFMLGSRFLIAPVVSEDDTLTVELPAGQWKDDLGIMHSGPAVLELDNVPIERLPYYEMITE
ncbi:MAG: glycoside hydrolase, partial [Bacteroidales bacterium]|nr:glycoside hydrolase [Bacteroidales bacterium]